MAKCAYYIESASPAIEVILLVAIGDVLFAVIIWNFACIFMCVPQKMTPILLALPDQ